MVTDDTVAVNEAEVEPEATVTEAGTVTELLLLDNVTTVPPEGAAELSVTVQASDPAPVNELVVQVSALTVGVGVATFSWTAKLFDEEFVLAVNVAD